MADPPAGWRCRDAWLLLLMLSEINPAINPDRLGVFRQSAPIIDSLFMLSEINPAINPDRLRVLE